MNQIKKKMLPESTRLIDAVYKAFQEVDEMLREVFTNSRQMVK